MNEEPPKPQKPKLLWPPEKPKPPMTAAERVIYSTSLGFKVNQSEDLDDPKRPNMKRR